MPSELPSEGSMAQPVLGCFEFRTTYIDRNSADASRHFFLAVVGDGLVGEGVGDRTGRGTSGGLYN